VWKVISGRCHLDREPIKAIEQAGFKLDVSETGYIPSPKWAT